MQKLDIAIYARLLDRLAHDKDFRARVEADPGTALAELQIELESHPTSVTLPTTEQLEAAHVKLSMIFGASCLVPLVIHDAGFFVKGSR